MFVDFTHLDGASLRQAEGRLDRQNQAAARLSFYYLLLPHGKEEDKAWATVSDAPGTT